MKKGSIVALLAIAAAIGIIITTFGDAGEYESFAVAKKNMGSTYHIVGAVDRDKEVYYEPEKDPNYFTFHMLDSIGNGMKVIYRDHKPSEFDMSDKMVIVGKAISEDEFEANTILTKCPSKYNEEEIAAEAEY